LLYALQILHTLHWGVSLRSRRPHMLILSDRLTGPCRPLGWTLNTYHRSHSPKSTPARASRCARPTVVSRGRSAIASPSSADTPQCLRELGCPPSCIDAPRDCEQTRSAAPRPAQPVARHLSQLARPRPRSRVALHSCYSWDRRWSPALAHVGRGAHAVRSRLPARTHAISDQARTTTRGGPLG